MLNVARLGWVLHRLRTGRRESIESVAREIRELAPGMEADVAPALSLPDGFSRVASVSPWTSREHEIAAIAGGRRTHAPTQAWLLEDAAVAGAWIYKGAYKTRRGHGQETWRSRGPVLRLERAYLLSNWAGSDFFGNFLLDDIPLALLPDAAEPTFVLRTRDYPHEEGYRELLGLPRPQRLDRARIGELVVFSDFSQNACKRARYSVLRSRLRSALGESTKADSTRVYLKRGPSGERRVVVNEAKLERHLSAQGFDIVEPAVLDAATISRRLLDARIVVSVEGSHLSHAIYSIAEGGTFLVLQPPDRFSTAYKDYADAMGMTFAYLVGHEATDGFTVDLAELDRLLEQILSHGE